MQLVGSIISKVVEEFEKRMPTQNEMVLLLLDFFPPFEFFPFVDIFRLDALLLRPIIYVPFLMKVAKTMAEPQISVQPSNAELSASSNEAKVIPFFHFFIFK